MGMWNLTADQLGHFVRLLQKCPSIASEANRENIISSLPEDIRSSVRSSVGGRADMYVESLIRTCQAYPGGIEALLEAVRIKDSGTFYWRDLEKWLQKEGLSVVEPETVPVVVVAMTSAEAELLPNLVCRDPEADECKRYQAFLQVLQQSGVELQDMSRRYGNRREEWRPWLALDQLDPRQNEWIPEIDRERTIAQMIDLVFNDLNNRRREKGFTELQPEYFGDRLFERSLVGSLEWSKMTRGLQTTGCLILVDPLSLFHPQLLGTLKDAELTSRKENVAILVIAPPSSGAMRVLSLIGDEISWRLPQTLERIEDINDSLYEFGITELRHLRRRLCFILADNSAFMAYQPDRRSLIETSVRNSESTGMANVILGMRGRGRS